MMNELSNREVSDLISLYKDGVDTMSSSESSEEEIMSAVGDIISSFGEVLQTSKLSEREADIEYLDQENLPEVAELENRLCQLREEEVDISNQEVELSDKQQRLFTMLDIASSRLMTCPHPLAKAAAVACVVAKKYIPVRNIRLENVIKQQVDVFNGILTQQLEAIGMSEEDLQIKMRDVNSSIMDRHSDAENTINSVVSDIQSKTRNSINNLFEELNNF